VTELLPERDICQRLDAALFWAFVSAWSSHLRSKKCREDKVPCAHLRIEMLEESKAETMHQDLLCFASGLCDVNANNAKNQHNHHLAPFFVELLWK
jgi:hypothetical protein